MTYPQDHDDFKHDDDFDDSSSKIHYAATPLRILALAEVSQPAFAELHQQGDTLEYNLTLLERLVPPQCADLDAAHAYLEPAIRDIRRTSPVAEATCAAWEQRTGGSEFPLVGKVGFLDIAERGKRSREEAENGGRD